MSVISGNRSGCYTIRLGKSYIFAFKSPVNALSVGLLIASLYLYNIGQDASKRIKSFSLTISL